MPWTFTLLRTLPLSPKAGLANFLKDQVVNVLGFEGHTVSVTASLLCSDRVETPIGGKWMDGHGCLPGKLYKNTQPGGFGPWALAGQLVL